MCFSADFFLFLGDTPTRRIFFFFSFFSKLVSLSQWFLCFYTAMQKQSPFCPFVYLLATIFSVSSSSVSTHARPRKAIKLSHTHSLIKRWQRNKRKNYEPNKRQSQFHIGLAGRKIIKLGPQPGLLALSHVRWPLRSSSESGGGKETNKLNMCTQCERIASSSHFSLGYTTEWRKSTLERTGGGSSYLLPLPSLAIAIAVVVSL